MSGGRRTAYEPCGFFRVILATARAHNAVLWTQDADFEGIEGVRFIKK
jgi:predicted nucleic acid-binding protein